VANKAFSAVSMSIWRVWFQNAINPFLCIREKCIQSLKFTGKCIRKFLDFGS
jgi:hypothetical protein